MSDLADYLGTKYGGWYNLAKLYGTKWRTKDWIGIPMGGGSGPCVYRVSWVKEAGYNKIPDDLEGFLTCARSCRRPGIRPARRLAMRSVTPTASPTGCCGPTAPIVVDENGKMALNSKETIAALKYATELQKTMIPGTLSLEQFGQQQGLCRRRDRPHLQRCVDLFRRWNSPDPTLQAIAEDTYLQTGADRGWRKRQPESALVLNAMVFKHSKYPNAAKDYLRFMMEEPTVRAVAVGLPRLLVGAARRPTPR